MMPNLKVNIGKKEMKSLHEVWKDKYDIKDKKNEYIENKISTTVEEQFMNKLTHYDGVILIIATYPQNIEKNKKKFEEFINGKYEYDDDNLGRRPGKTSQIIYNNNTKKNVPIRYYFLDEDKDSEMINDYNKMTIETMKNKNLLVYTFGHSACYYEKGIPELEKMIENEKIKEIETSKVTGEKKNNFSVVDFGNIMINLKPQSLFIITYNCFSGVTLCSSLTSYIKNKNKNEIIAMCKKTPVDREFDAKSFFNKYYNNDETVYYYKLENDDNIYTISKKNFAEKYLSSYKNKLLNNMQGGKRDTYFKKYKKYKKKYINLKNKLEKNL